MTESDRKINLDEETDQGNLAHRRRYEFSIFLDLGAEGATLVDREIDLLLDLTCSTGWQGSFDIPAKKLLSFFRDDPILEEKWEVDGKALVDKIERLTDTQAWFLCGFLRGWWQRQGEIQ